MRFEVEETSIQFTALPANEWNGVGDVDSLGCDRVVHNEYVGEISVEYAQVFDKHGHSDLMISHVLVVETMLSAQQSFDVGE